MNQNKIILALLLFFVASSSSVFAQKTVVKVNPLGLVFGQISLGIEHAITDKHAAALFVHRNSFKYGSVTNYGRLEVKGFGFTPEYRFYIWSPTESAPNGFYASPYMRFRFFNGTYELEKDIENPVSGETETYKGNGSIDVNVIGGGAMIGYQAIIKERFALDFFLGGGGASYSPSDVELTYNDDAGTKEVRTPGGLFLPAVRIGLALGVAF